MNGVDNDCGTEGFHSKLGISISHARTKRHDAKFSF